MPARKRWIGWITTESAALTQPLPWQRAARRIRRAERIGAEHMGAGHMGAGHIGAGRAGAALAC
ncbi:MAG: hypothetical protein JJU42_09575 [Rhodobacteraceae bacterium]|nr:hypothetical protein [Paracoccaceae bacterium]